MLKKLKRAVRAALAAEAACEAAVETAETTVSVVKATGFDPEGKNIVAKAWLEASAAHDTLDATRARVRKILKKLLARYQ